ncbi:fluoride efflux transporter CrcB [Pusillimonas sp. T7-7]|uniref:fluoride efflux transporter CrcB n=1 Tax=Pusillimonas sp. (strain T7-7) TaxID=1007105 RepID=UPI0005A0A5F2|nr:fluoride efflux transporter CrcB [Pusillimonas sp. T7-7]
MAYLLVFLGAGLGGMARYGINLAFLKISQPGGFPFGTLFINVLGSLLMGALLVLVSQHAGLPRHTQLFLATGVLGGFTTFSTFSLETMALLHRGQLLAAVLYVLVSVIGAIGGMALIMHFLKFRM